MDFEEIKELIHGRGMEGGGEPLHSPPYIREGGGEPLHIINSPPYIREGNGGGGEPLHLWEGNGGAHHINGGKGGELYVFQVVFTLEHTVISIVS